MRLDEIFGQERAMRILREALLAERIPQAYLFTGPAGVGKKSAALALGAALNCPLQATGCGECPSCRRADKGNHPDIRLIEPEKRIIRIDTIRELSEAASYKPFEGQKKVFVIDQADLLNQPAANSLLKTLEEPPKDTLLVLVSSNPHNLLSTVRSRCQQVEFSQLPKEQIQAWLAEKYQLPPEISDLVYFLTQGSLGEIAGLDMPGLLKLRDEVIKSSSTGYGITGGKLVDHARTLAADKAGIDLWFKLLISWYRDMLLVKGGVKDDLLAHTDKVQVLEEIARKYTTARLLDDIDTIHQIYDGIRQRANTRLALENMFFKLGA